MESELWTVQRIMDWTRSYFGDCGVDTARLDTEVLLSHVLGKDRVYLYTHFDRPLTGEEREAFRGLVKRRAKREPVAYILGEKEFYGRCFRVTRDTLIPRPETEHLIDGILKWVRTEGPELDGSRPLRVLDVGTGTGCIALTLAGEIQGVELVATDLSEATLSVARDNARRLGLEGQVEFRCGDLLGPVAGESFDIIVSNPPYVEESARAVLQPEVRDFEPPAALFAGDDGMAVIDRLVPQVWTHLNSGGMFALEFGSSQRELVAQRLTQGWRKYWIEEDLQGHPRSLFAERS